MARKRTLKDWLQFEGDYLILIITLVISILGLIMVYSSSWPEGISKHGEGSYFFKKQLQSFAVGIVAMIFVSKVRYEAFVRSKWMNIIFFLILILNVSVHFFGTEIYGAKRWLELGPISFMPSDLLKITSVAYMAKVLSDRGSMINKKLVDMLPALLLIAVPTGIIVSLQSDLGTAGTLGVSLFMMFFISGVKKIYPIALGVIGLLSGAVLIAIEPYRAKRFYTFLDPFQDIKGDGWQVVQSLYAIGSGGILGAGLGQSKQKYYYLPFPYNDFIFSVFAEEFGLIGSIMLICLYLALFIAGMRVAILSRNRFDSFLAFGVSSLIFVQTLIHIGVVSALMPATGITMPLFSYGGTSLVINLISVGVLLNISSKVKRRKKARNE